jgi:hypothetical protein
MRKGIALDPRTGHSRAHPAAVLGPTGSRPATTPGRCARHSSASSGPSRARSAVTSSEVAAAPALALRRGEDRRSRGSGTTSLWRDHRRHQRQEEVLPTPPTGGSVLQQLDACVCFGTSHGRVRRDSVHTF